MRITKVDGITDSADDGLFGGWSEAIYLEPGVVAAIVPSSVTAEITSVAGAVARSMIALARISEAFAALAIGAPVIGLHSRDG